MPNNTIGIRPELKEWINMNLKRGCEKKKIFKFLLDNKFEYDLIKNILKIDYEYKK